MTTFALLTAFTLVLPIAAPPAPDYTPAYQRIRASLAQEGGPLSGALDISTLSLSAARHQAVTVKQADSIWNGVVLGALACAGGGYLWGRNLCPNDRECQFRSVPAGILGGAGIGAALGGILDALHR